MENTRDRIIYSFQFKTYTTIQKEDTWQKVAYERMQMIKGVDVDIDEIGPRKHKPDGTPEAQLKIDLPGA